MFSEHAGEYALVVAIFLVIAHLAGPFVCRVLHSHSARVASFGGGLAVAYVFLQLIPELELAHEYVGERIHFIVLVSVLVFFAIEIHILGRYQHATEGDDSEPRARVIGFWFHIALSWVYTWLIVFALPGDIANDFLFALFGSLAIGLHVIYKDYVLLTHHRALFENRGRYVLMTAPLIGWLTHARVGMSEPIYDLFLAILAGFLIQSVFRDELPSYDKARFLWLAAGALVFLALVLILP